jgi:hypothetical protein
MDLAVALGIALLLGIAIGAVAVHYIHNVASAASRAITPPASVAASVPAPVAAALSDIQARLTVAEAALSTAAPKA